MEEMLKIRKTQKMWAVIIPIIIFEMMAVTIVCIFVNKRFLGTPITIALSIIIGILFCLAYVSIKNLINDYYKARFHAMKSAYTFCEKSVTNETLVFMPCSMSPCGRMVKDKEGVPQFTKDLGDWHSSHM